MLSEKDLIKLIAKSSLFYKSLKEIRCPTLNNQLIIFGNSGFTHLIRKDRKMRPKDDCYRRLMLMKYVPQIIKNENTKINYKIISSKKYGRITFWVLTQQIDSRLIKVIFRQYGKGSIHFRSVMDVKTQKPLKELLYSSPPTTMSREEFNPASSSIGSLALIVFESTIILLYSLL
jgi:hypothetical protein